MARHTWTSLFTVRSSSSDSTYEVKRDPKTGAYGCSCKGWKFQKKSMFERECKHTRVAREAIEALESKEEKRMKAALSALERMGARDSVAA